MLLHVLFVLCAAAEAGAWLNDYDQPVNFECPTGQVLTHINSQHSNHNEDRVWDFGCSPLPLLTEGGLSNCEWTNYVNEYDQPLTFQCPRDAVITGTASVHDNGKEDRRFRFQCCDVPGAVLHACYFTGWENAFDGLLDFTVPTNKVLRGVDSYHDNGKEDRRFKFELCEMLLQ